MSTHVCVVCLIHAETPWTSIKHLSTTITHNAFLDCRVRLYAYCRTPTAVWRQYKPSGVGASVNSTVCSEPRLLADSRLFKDFEAGKGGSLQCNEYYLSLFHSFTLNLLCLVFIQRSFRDDEMASLTSVMKRINLISDLRGRVRKACDCSFIHWHRVRWCISVPHWICIALLVSGKNSTKIFQSGYNSPLLET